MLPPGFYNQVDKDIYAAGDFFIPRERFRAAPYTVNKPTNPDEVPAGIPAVYQAQGGGGGGTYTGTIGGLTSDFFNQTSDRQDRLRSINMPLEQKGVPGGDILMENLQGYVGQPDDYLGIEEYNEALSKYSGMEGPQTIKGAPGVYQAGAKNTLGRRIQDGIYSIMPGGKPQTADMILNEGYNRPYGTTGLGIVGMIGGMLDNYKDLPVADQAFIAKNMGYTGPTVFGENRGGQDPFGLYTRSGSGNYAERVGVESEKLGDALSATGAIGGKKDFQGATFNPATGMFEADDDSDLTPEQVAALNQRTKMVRAKYNFYTKQNQDYADMVQKAAEIQAAKDKDIVNKIDVTADDVASTTTQGGGGGIADSSYGQGGGLDASKMGGGSQQAKSGGQKAGGTERTDGGWGWADGGRVYYMDGGLADLVDIYD